MGEWNGGECGKINRKGGVWYETGELVVLWDMSSGVLSELYNRSTFLNYVDVKEEIVNKLKCNMKIQ